MTNETAPRILVAEDEWLIATLLQDYLEQAGYRVALVARLREGLAMAANGKIDAAILDINLGGESSLPVAQVLRERAVPFLFASGYGVDSLTEEFADTPLLRKPYDMGSMLDALRGLL